jgi:subtilisin-like proprotein convertase family protein
VSKAYRMTVPATHQVGVPVVLNARVTFAGASSPTTAKFSVDVGEPSPTTVDFAYTGAAVAIPDNSTVGATVTIPVSGIGPASKIAFSVDGATCNTTEGSATVGINHTFVGDLVGILTSPSGASATVFSGAGGSGNNMCQVVFTDEAAAPFASVTSSLAPFTGSWRPDDAFAGLRGQADGDWTFSAFDLAGADTGSIRAVSLHLNGYVTP